MGKNESAKQFPGQYEGEAIQLLVRQHPLVMRKPLILGLFVILVAILPLDFPQIYASAFWSGVCWKIAMLTPIVVFALWFYRWVSWYYTIYILTDERILEIVQQGFFRRRIGEWQLSNIENVDCEISGLQAVLFGYGDITARTWTVNLTMKTIHHPHQVYEQLVAAVQHAGGGSTPPQK